METSYFPKLCHLPKTEEKDSSTVSISAGALKRWHCAHRQTSIKERQPNTQTGKIPQFEGP